MSEVHAVRDSNSTAKKCAKPLKTKQEEKLLDEFVN